MPRLDRDTQPPAPHSGETLLAVDDLKVTFPIKDGLFGKTFQWIRHPYPNESAARDVQRAIQAALA